MISRFAAILTALAVAAGGWTAAQSARPSAVIDSTQLLRDLQTLSAADMAGRQTGTPGGEKARAYVVERFRASGLQPVGDSFAHPFTFRSGRGEAATDRTGVNVLGRIDGTRDPTRYIVISAHYDHIGVRNGEVFNGADDNASGTAALFALAQYFATHRPANSLIFAAFDAEESGLRGARAFVQTPPVPADALVLNLNMDMIGRDPDDKLFASGTYSQPFLKPMIERIAASAPVKLLMGHDNPNEKGVEDWTGSSDHGPFCAAKIPCLYFGVEDFANHHKASDDYETMTHDFYVRVVETMVAAVKEFDASLDAVVKRGLPQNEGSADDVPLTEGPADDASDSEGPADDASDSEGPASAGLTVGGLKPAPPTVAPPTVAPPTVAPPTVASPTVAPATVAPLTVAQSQDVTLETAAGSIFGTLLVPASPARPPVVLIIAGSGPTDRDGNSATLKGHNDSLKMLAESLAAAGVASLRYDKRGIGASRAAGAGGEAAMRFESLVDNAAGWITMLRNDARFPIVAVAGHSEGSLVGMLAARMARADGFVSIAGPARRFDAVLRDQLRPQLSPLPQLWDTSESVLASLVAGQTVAEVPQLLMALYRPSVQPYLISLLRYTPTVELARLVVPVLLIQGTTDVQISVDEAKALAAARPGAKLAMVDGMNHVLKAVSGPLAAQVPSYSDPTLPIVAEVPDAIAAFVQGLSPLGRGGVGGERPRQARRSPRTLVVGDIGGTRIVIEHGQPQKRGRAIWGALVPWSGVWMPGADEATTMTTRETIVIGSLEVPAGDYTLYTVPRADGVTLVVNRQVGQFHTVYNQSSDLGRVPMAMSPVSGAPIEGLTYGIATTPTGARLTLSWDDRQYSVPVIAKTPGPTR